MGRRPCVYIIRHSIGYNITFTHLGNIIIVTEVEIYNRIGTATIPQKNLHYWHWNLYWFSTGIAPKSVVRRHLVSELGFYYASTAPASARYHLSSTGIAPSLQLGRYSAVCKYWHESDFSTWECSKKFPSELRRWNRRWYFFSSLKTF